MVKGFEGGCRRPEQRHRVFKLGAHNRNVSPVVARRLLLLVARLLLLIHDDEAEFVDRGKNRGTSPDDHAGFPVSNAPPFPSALDVAERGVQDGHAFEARAKPGAALPAYPQRQRNFRHKYNRGFSAG